MRNAILTTLLLLIVLHAPAGNHDKNKTGTVYKVIDDITIYQDSRGRIYYYLTSRVFNRKYKVYLKKDKNKQNNKS